MALIAVFALAMGANAQDPGAGRGRMGGFGPQMGAPPDARLLGAWAGRPGRVVKNAPYSAEMVTETTQVLADGNRIRQTSTVKVYRDSEGRARSEQTLSGLGALAPAAGPQQVIFINDPVAGVNYALNPADRTGTKSTWAPRGGPQAARGPRGENGPQATIRAFGRGGMVRENVKTESLGRQTIDGIPADGTRTTQTIPAGAMGNEQPIQIVSERWYSPDLQVVVLSKHSDPRTGETVSRLTNISRSDPAPSLFQAPAEYKLNDAGRPGPMMQPRGRR